MSTQTAPLGLRLFLEGIEVPVIAAQVNCVPDQPAQASIQIIPTDMSLNLLPRTLVHLFFLDTELTDEDVEKARAAAGAQSVNPNRASIAEHEIDRYEASDWNYKLLFCGEVMGYTYNKTSSARQLVLQCIDLSSYWDACYQWFADYSVGGDGLTDKTHQFLEAGEGLFDNVAKGTQWMIGRLLTSKPLTPEYQNSSGLLGGMIHLFEAVGGIKHRGTDLIGYNGVNDFFSIAELRYNLLGMLGAIEEDKTSAQIYSGKAFYNWMRNGMCSMGTLLSFRDIVMHVCRYVFHNLYPNPCPRYMPPGYKQIPHAVRVPATVFTDQSTGKFIKEDLKIIYKALGTASLTLLKLLSDASSGQTTMVAIEDLVAVKKIIAPTNVQLRDAIRLVGLLTSDDKATVTSTIQSVSSKLVAAYNQLPSTPTSAQGDNATVAKDVKDALEGILQDIADLIGLKHRTKKTVTRERSTKVGGHLFSQLFLPETFFVSPPRCNVIFPDQYYNLTYSRNFAREVTRLACQGGLSALVGGGAQGAKLFGRSYFAPNIKDARGNTLAATMSRGARILLPHEVHSGIIPKLEWVSDGHRWGIVAASGTKSRAEVSKIQKVNYLQRLANFQFFLHRWASRNLAIQGIFMPNLVLGLPAVIIDRSAPAPAVVEQLEKMMGRRMLPTQFIGKIISLSHSISQAGATSAANFAYVRTHRGLDDEFLGVMTEEEMVDSPPDTEIFSVKRLAQDPKYAVTFNKRSLYLELVRRYVNKKLQIGMYVENLGKVTRVIDPGQWKATREEAVISLGLEESYYTAHKGPDGTLPLPENLTVEFTRRVKTGRFVRSTMAFEDKARPRWMNYPGQNESMWDNKHITEAVYWPLLGTYAITDDKSIGQAAQDELLKRQQTDAKRRIEFGDQEITYGSGMGAGTASVESVPGGEKYTVVGESVEETIDGLSIVYGMMKERDSEIWNFIREFTKRPIASLIEVLGSANLRFLPNGLIEDAATMTEGFHSRAYGDYNVEVQRPKRAGDTVIAGGDALGNLMPGVAAPAAEFRPGVMGKRQDRKAIEAALDPRGRSRARVRAYVAELKISRGMMGS
jgi:hypothetical protein